MSPTVSDKSDTSRRHVSATTRLVRPNLKWNSAEAARYGIDNGIDKRKQNDPNRAKDLSLASNWQTIRRKVAEQTQGLKLRRKFGCKNTTKFSKFIRKIENFSLEIRLDLKL